MAKDAQSVAWTMHEIHLMGYVYSYSRCVRSSNPNRTRTEPRDPKRELNVGLRSRSEPLKITVKFGVRVRKILPEPDVNRTSRPLRENDGEDVPLER